MSGNIENHLPDKHIRPRFSKDTSFSLEELTKMISDKLKEEDAYCVGYMKHGFATIQIPKADQHYWSPQLTLTCDEDEYNKDKGTILRGVYGPRPAVWTMFIFFYLAIGMAIMIISLVGFSNMSLGNSYNILWFVPFLLIAFFSLFFVSKQGKKMGHDELIVLHDFIEDAIGMELYEE